MIKIENAEVMGWEAAIRGMRNPKNSWEKSDSCFCHDGPDCEGNCAMHIGPNDKSLMMMLRHMGSDHRKFMRMITVYIDISAPLYWWKEFDTYKVGTVADSCSTMHKLTAKEFEMDDFSHEHLNVAANAVLKTVVDTLNTLREAYTGDEIKEPAWKKDIWYMMIQLLPSSYNQRRTVMLNYEVLTNMYEARKNHKLDEWREFCQWIEGLPFSELITLKPEKD